MITDPNKAHYLTKEECKAKTAELTKLQEDDPNYMIALKFIKDEAGWYADVPTHTRGQNAMVAGADTLLTLMAGDKNELIVKFRFIENKALKPIVTLKHLAGSHQFGDTYLAHGLSVIPFPCYICAVGHDLYGKAPKKIYVYGIERK